MMDPEHRKKLKDTSLISRLLPLINFDALEESLKAKHIFTPAMIDDIKEKAKGEEAVLYMLNRLPKRGPHAYNRFVEALRENGMHSAVDILTGQVSSVHPNPAQQQWQGAAELGIAMYEPAAGGDQRSVTPTGTDGVLRNGKTQVVCESDAEHKVVPATECKIGDHIYKMTRNPRGWCIIINNRDFGGILPLRQGSELDAQRMGILFRALGFRCKLENNLSKEEIISLLTKVSKSNELWQDDCLVVILMSHGKLHTLFDKNGDAVETEDLLALFHNANCPALQAKPKLFLIQACRGGKYDGGTDKKLDTIDAGSFAAAAVLPADSGMDLRLPTWSDMYIAYSTIPGYVSHKNEETGSWFLRAVFRVFREHACSMHLDTMMRRVASEVHKRRSHDGSRQSISLELRGWLKKLYFNPGFPIV